MKKLKSNHTRFGGLLGCTIHIFLDPKTNIIDRKKESKLTVVIPKEDKLNLHDELAKSLYAY